MIRSLVVSILACFLFILGISGSKARAEQKWTTYERPAQYGIVSEKNVKIPMRDGVNLIADIYYPADETGARATGKFPVLITQTPYNKLIGIGKENPYLVERGYIYLVVDVRGTGHSPGTWQGFSEVEQRDGYDLVEWAAKQEWSDGNVGLHGGSYMAINQIFTAALQPPSLKAIFPTVPMADAYRDIVMSGGQANIAFIPLWLGLITGGGLIPPTNLPADPLNGLLTLTAHAGGVTDFQLNAFTSALLGGDFAYDGARMRMMSPIHAIDNVKVPAFFTGGLNDIFQRGTPLLYERLKQNGVPTKLLVGNWTHSDYGSGLPADGVPNLDQIALRWFDQYVKGIDTKAEEMPDVTQYVIGEGVFKVQPDWPHPGAKAKTFYLQPGRSLSLVKSREHMPDMMLQHPVNGVCSGSTNQWLIGLVDFIPCMQDNRFNEIGELTYTTDVLEEDVYISGPIGAELYASTTQKEAILSVRVTDVAPDGKSKELTAGWLAASFRQLDEENSRYLDGKIIQPWHPYTRDSVLPVNRGEVMKLNVEIFPTNAVIKKGHRLRIAIGPSDFPHSIPPVPQLLNSVGGIVNLHHSEEYPSQVTFPVVPVTQTPRVHSALASENTELEKPTQQHILSKQHKSQNESNSDILTPQIEKEETSPPPKTEEARLEQSKPQGTSREIHAPGTLPPPQSESSTTAGKAVAQQRPQQGGNLRESQSMPTPQPKQQQGSNVEESPRAQDEQLTTWWTAAGTDEGGGVGAHGAYENETHEDYTAVDTVDNEGELEEIHGMHMSLDDDREGERRSVLPIIFGLLALAVPVGAYFIYFT